MSSSLLRNFFFGSCCILVLASCSDNIQKETKAPIDKEDKWKLGFGSLVGDDGLTFGPGKKSQGSQVIGSMVNPHLWRASLDTVNFLPLVSADAMGGVIITDWYATPKNANERLKVTIYISDQVLRADAVKVNVHKQVKGKDGNWMSATADEKVATELENIILTKARQLRINSAS